MAAAIANPDFFKREKEKPKAPAINSTLTVAPEFESLFNESIALFDEENLDSFSAEISKYSVAIL